MFKIMKIVFR